MSKYMDSKSGAIVAFFKELGFELYEFKDSVFRDEPSAWVFQTDHKNHTIDCSTILFDDAIKIFNKLGIGETFGVHCKAGKHLIKLQDCKKCKQEATPSSQVREK